MSGKAFLDTNILVYTASTDEPHKAVIAEGLVKAGHIISPQVVFECFNVFLKKHHFSKDQAIGAIRGLIFHLSIVPEDDYVVSRAISIFKQYAIHPYDAKIAAAAIIAGCTTLYTEDLQHGLVIDGVLTVNNPFL